MVAHNAAAAPAMRTAHISLGVKVSLSLGIALLSHRDGYAGQALLVSVPSSRHRIVRIASKIVRSMFVFPPLFGIFGAVG